MQPPVCVIALAVVLCACCLLWAYRLEEGRRNNDAFSGLLVIGLPVVFMVLASSALSGACAYMAMKSRGANSGSAMNVGAGVMLCAMCLCSGYTAFNSYNDQQRTKRYNEQRRANSMNVNTPTPTVE